MFPCGRKKTIGYCMPALYAGNHGKCIFNTCGHTAAFWPCSSLPQSVLVAMSLRQKLIRADWIHQENKIDSWPKTTKTTKNIILKKVMLITYVSHKTDRPCLS